MNKLEVFVVGVQVDYWSSSYESWVPTCIKHVNQETGEVTLSNRQQPISRQQAEFVLRPRTQPTEWHLRWVADVLRRGEVDAEAKRLFLAHAICPARSQFDEDCVLTRPKLHELGRTLDNTLGISGSAYELLRRASKQAEKGPGLPAGWVRRWSETAGREFYEQRDGKGQWELPADVVTLSLDCFVAAFWEMVVAVDQRWGQAFELKDKCLRSRSDMEKDYAFKDYSFGGGLKWHKLGSGTFGSVYLAKHRRTGIKRAVKVVPQKEIDSRSLSRLDSEIGRLQILDHPHIVRLYDVYKGTSNFYIFMDYCSGGDLSKHSKHLKDNGKRMAEREICNVMRQLLLAVNHVHAHGLLHLDIKPANVVVMPELRTMPPGHGPDPNHEGECLAQGKRPLHVMLIDLGLARVFRPGNFKSGSSVGTPATMAPEVWRGMETPAADIFSCGCTFYFLLTDKYPFIPAPMSPEEASSFWAVRPKRREYPQKIYSHHLYSLCDRMLEQERLCRPTACQCLREDFLQQGGPLTEEGEQLERLAKTSDRSLLYMSVALSIAATWPSHRLPAIRRAFQELDTKGTGRLKRDQIVQALQGLGVDQGKAVKAADAMDLSRDGIIEWTEFVAACIRLGSEPLEKDLLELFKEADTNNDGFLDRHEIAKLLAIKHLREDVVDKTMQQLLGDRTPKEKSPKVDWHTFRRHFASIPARQPPRSRTRDRAEN